MSSQREVRGGETIALRVRFKDDLQENAEASGVFVHIYDPTETIFDISDPSNATVISGVATSLGEGVFEYEYTPPNIDGIWTDMWEGQLTDQPVSGLFNFEVSASGTVTSLASQLADNDVVSVTIPSGLMATDGMSLEEPYVFEFMTTTTPSYSSIRKVRLEVGNFVRNLYDDTIQTAILEASIEANIINFFTDEQNTPVFQHARREYVTCLASSILLYNIASGAIKTKTLQDLHVEYDTAALDKSLDRLRDCTARWEPQVIGGGLSRKANQPKMVIKGESDPDRPVYSRMWQSTDEGGISRRIPAANSRERPANKRRTLRTWNKRYW